MRPKDALYTKWSDAKDSVLIGGSGNYKVSLLGSNLASSVLPCGHSRIDGFTLAIPKGKKGVVAVRAFRSDAGRKGDSIFEADFFVNVDNSGEKPNVDLTEVWVPSASRMGHIHNFGYIEVQIGEERFTTDKAEFTNGKHKEPNTYTVDGNTLVRYLVNEATEDEVRDASKDHVAEISAREKLAQLEALRQEALEEVSRFVGELEKVKRAHQTSLDALEKWRNETLKHRKFLVDLGNALGRRKGLMWVGPLYQKVFEHLRPKV